MSTPSSISYTGDGSTIDRTFPFAYLDADHVKVTLDGVLTEDWSLIAPNTVRFTSAPAVGVKIRIYRETPGDALVTWSDGAVILGRHLNNANTQNRYISQEARDYAEDTYGTVAELAEETQVNATSAEEDAAAAAASEADAEAAALAAAESASDASADAYGAGVFADEADASADLATLKAAEAAASAAAADASADLAQGYATSAVASAGSAAASAAAALTSLDNFDDRYLGQKASDPTVDNDGNALVMGALYFDTTLSKMKVYSGASWGFAFNDTSAASAVPNDSTVSGASVKDALDTLNTGKAASSHTHAQSEITDLLTDLAFKVSTSRQINTSGLATGGGTLAANRTIDVPVATQEEAEAGTSEIKAMTPLRVTQAIAALAATSAPPTVEVFTTSGTWTRPDGCKAVKVTVVGAGGGGGAARGTADPAYMSYAGTGATGGLSFKWLDVTAISSVTVTIGAGGTAGEGSPGNGGQGGTTSFGSHAQVTGGLGGVGAYGTTGAHGATGGVASLGDININGIPGQSDACELRFGFMPPKLTSHAAGAAGVGYGSPGQGAVRLAGGYFSGGAGAGGLIIVEEFY